MNNCLVDSGDLSNVIPYSVCKKINAEPQICRTKIIQLDRLNVKVMGELKDVLILLASNSKVHQTIEFIIVDSPEAYGVILGRDWFAKLNGYFSTNWYHLWFMYKGHPNKIKVERKCYMKHTETDPNDPNEPVMFSKSIPGNFCFDTFFGELEVELSPFADSNTQSELLHSTQIAEPNCTLVDSSNCTLVDSSCSNFYTNLTNPNLWTLYFHGSRKKLGVVVGCPPIDPH